MRDEKRGCVLDPESDKRLADQCTWASPQPCPNKGPPKSATAATILIPGVRSLTLFAGRLIFWHCRDDSVPLLNQGSLATSIGYDRPFAITRFQRTLCIRANPENARDSLRVAQRYCGRRVHTARGFTALALGFLLPND